MITKDLRGHEPAGEAEGLDGKLPRPGDLFAKRYAIDEVLGEGGFGAVFRARDTQLDREVALKVLHRNADDPVALARFLQEARAAAALSSDHVAIVHEVGVDSAPFLVMELLRGRDLQAELDERERIPVGEAVHMLLEAMLGLAPAHARNIVHRDLKPRNLFLAVREDGTAIVKVLDFGVAKSDASGLTQSGVALGTPRYMAPEQLRNARGVDARADIWALGVVLYELTTGHPIFDAETGVEFAAQIVVDPHVPLRERVPSLPAELEAIVDRCLQKDAANRPADLVELARALAPLAPDAASLVTRIEHTLQRRTTTASPSSRPALTVTRAAPTVNQLPPRRSHAPAIVAIAIGAGGIAFGAYAWLRDPPVRATSEAPVAATTTDASPAIAPATPAIPATTPDALGTPPDAPPPASTQDARATPRPRARAGPSKAERDALNAHCLSRATSVPTFLAAGAQLHDHACAQLAKLGCTTLRKRCATEAITEDERTRCRDFLRFVTDRGTCP